MNKIQLLKEGQEGFGLLIEQDAGFINYDITKYNKNLFENIKENQLSDRHFYIDCKLQEADVLNRNGRIYPKDLLVKKIADYQELVKNNAALSEADHPDSLQVSLHNVSHRIVKTWWEGNSVYGTIDLIVSDSFLENGLGWTIGDKIALYLKRKLKLGISSRGIGSVKKINNKLIVQDDFEIICFDLVSTPSTPNAYLFIETINTNINENIQSKPEKDLNIKLFNIINT
jgi:hypothetical protein